MNKRSIFLLLLLVTFAFSVSAYHNDPFGSVGGYGYGLDAIELDDPKAALTGFVAPFLLIAILFQRGYEKALSFSYANNDDEAFGPWNQSQERERIQRYSMIMALATAGIIVPTPWFQLIKLWVADIFSLLGILFFGAIFVAFIWLLWKVFS